MPGPRTPRQQSESCRAAIYARVSDKSQAEDDKTSIAEQLGGSTLPLQYTSSMMSLDDSEGWPGLKGSADAAAQ